MSSRGERVQAPGRIPLVEEIASVIRERIYSHRYPAGSWLRQEHLSAELGVSRMPLREALRLLEQEGLVQSKRGQGTRVVSGDLDTLLDAYQLRAVVDGLAARLVAQRVADGADKPGRHLHRAIQMQQSALKPWKPREYTQSNVDFHEQVILLSGNDFVISQTPILRMTAQVFKPVALVQPETALRAIPEHIAIVGAIDRGDAAAAERLARAHIDATIAQLEASRRAAATETADVS